MSNYSSVLTMNKKQVIPINKILEYVVQAIWVKKYWESLFQYKLADGFGKDAETIIDLIITEVVIKSKLVDFYGVKVPKTLVPYLRKRLKTYGNT